MQLRITLIALVAIAALAFGCGGDSDTSNGGTASGAATSGDTSAADGGSTESSDGDSSNAANDGGDSGPLTKAEFIKQGEGICRQVPVSYNEALQKLEQEAKKQGKPKLSTAEGNEKAAIPPLPKAIEEFEALVPPAGDENEAEAIVDSLQAALEGLEAKPASALSGPESPFDEFQKLTKKYGFEFCSQL